MALMNVLNKLTFTPSQAAPQQQTNAAPRQQAAPKLPQGDTFVRSTPAATLPVGRPALPSTPAPATQNLGFADMMAKDPGMIWNTALTPRTQQALDAYKRGLIGRSVQNLDLRNMTAQQVRQELTRRGFTCEMGVIKDVRTGKPVVSPKTGKAVPMEIWSNPDGGMVRIKPEGDPTSMHRPQAHLSISVKYPPSASGHDFNDEAFKVDAKGNPMPKWAKDVQNPFPADTPAGKKFLDDHANCTHTNLR